MAAPLLEVEGITASYGSVPALEEVSFSLQQGELLLLAGPNGAGKSTLMRVLVGLHRPARGEVRLKGRRANRWAPHVRTRRGLAWIPEGRGVIAELSVRENLDLARFGPRWSAERRSEVLERFPVLAGALDRPAGTLSGGEQQMLALGRALASGPDVMLVDEPSLGLAPMVVANMMEVFKALRDEGHSILVVEQRAALVQHIASRVLLIRRGRVSTSSAGLDFTEIDFTEFAHDDGHRGIAKP